MKYYIILSCFLLTSLFSAAQSFKGGILAGMTTSQYDGDSYSGFHRIGISGGVYVAHDISEKFLWQMEIKFIQKGSFQSPNFDPPSPKFDLRLNYFEVPFYIKYDYKYKLSFEAGLGLGYLSYHHEYLNDAPFDLTGSRPFHKYEISYQIGGYYQILKNLAVNIRYSYSILPVRPHAGGGKHGFNWGEYNNVINFSLYYQFNKKDE